MVFRRLFDASGLGWGGDVIVFVHMAGQSQLASLVGQKGVCGFGVGPGG